MCKTIRVLSSIMLLALDEILSSIYGSKMLLAIYFNKYVIVHKKEIKTKFTFGQVGVGFLWLKFYSFFCQKFGYMFFIIAH